MTSSYGAIKEAPDSTLKIAITARQYPHSHKRHPTGNHRAIRKLNGCVGVRDTRFCVMIRSGSSDMKYTHQKPVFSTICKMFICVSIYALIKDEQFVMIELLIHKATCWSGRARPWRRRRRQARRLDRSSGPVCSAFLIPALVRGQINTHRTCTR